MVFRWREYSRSDRDKETEISHIGIPEGNDDASDPASIFKGVAAGLTADRSASRAETIADRSIWESSNSRVEDPERDV